MIKPEHVTDRGEEIADLKDRYQFSRQVHPTLRVEFLKSKGWTPKKQWALDPGVMQTLMSHVGGPRGGLAQKAAQMLASLKGGKQREMERRVRAALSRGEWADLADYMQ